MHIQELISGLAGSNIEAILLVTFVGAWVIILLAIRRRWQQSPLPEVDMSAEPDHAASSQLARKAVDRIDFDLGQAIMPAGYGRGCNLRAVSTDSRVEHYSDFEPGTHDPLHIDLLESYINPRGVDQVGMKRQSHKEKLLIVIDATNVNIAGSPSDYVDEVEAMKALAETIVRAATKNKFPTGVIGPRGHQPIHQRPGSTKNQLLDAIRLVSPTSNASRVKAFHKEVETKSQSAKAVIVISSFQSPASQKLVGKLSRRPRLIAVQVLGEWDDHFGGLPSKVAVDIGDGQVRPLNLAKFQPEFVQQAELWQSEINQAIGSDFSYLKIKKYRPDIPNQLVSQMRQLLVA